MTKPTIHWINHASYIVVYDDISLLVDPWFDGKVFNNGWEHIAKSKVDDVVLDSVTHVWFSHEHPDHFFPPNLGKLFEKFSNKPKILFQKTLDKRVVGFCKARLDCEVIELDPGERFELGENSSIQIYPHGQIDSYSICKFGDTNILNVNDCVMHESDITDIKTSCSSFDIMLCQFSYAGWISNVDEAAERVKAVEDKLSVIKRISESLEIKTIIPFASFIYFCHEENRYMNDCVPSIAVIHDFIEKECRGDAAVLYPGDVWNIEKKWNSQASIKKYDHDQNLEREYVKAPIVSDDELEELGKKYFDRLIEKNGRLPLIILGMVSKLMLKLSRVGLGPVKIKITDSGSCYRFDLINGFKKLPNGSDVDVVMSGDCLSYMFKFEWGFSTLAVNGRFQTTHRRGYLLLARAFSLGQVNSTGSTLTRHLFNRMMNKQEERIHNQEASFLN